MSIVFKSLSMVGRVEGPGQVSSCRAVYKPNTGLAMSTQAGLQLQLGSHSQAMQGTVDGPRVDYSLTSSSDRNTLYNIVYFQAYIVITICEINVKRLSASWGIIIDGAVGSNVLRLLSGQA